jgi:hypothetical protein
MVSRRSKFYATEAHRGATQNVATAAASVGRLTTKWSAANARHELERARNP